MKFLSIENFNKIKNNLINKNKLNGQHYNTIYMFMKEVEIKYKNENIESKNKITEIIVIDYISKYFRNNIDINNININNTNNEEYNINQIIIKDKNKEENLIEYKPDNILNVEDKEKSVLLPKPNKELKNTIDKIKSINDIREEYILIDSRDRNYDNYNENDYKLILNKKYKNIIDIELISAIIPNSQTLIHSNNNTIYIKESNDSVIEIPLTNGNYTSISSLASEIQDKLNFYGNSSYSVSTNDNKRFSELSNITNSINTSGFTSIDNLFDGLTNTHWTKSSSSTGTFIITLNEPKTINEYTIICYLSDGFPSEWDLDISFDGNNWVNIDSQTGQSLSQFITSSYSLSSNTLSSKYIRFTVNNISSGTDIHITNIEFKETSNNTLTITSDLTGGDGIFSLLFEDYNNTPYNLLGFNKQNYENFNNYSSLKEISFTRDNYIYLNLNSLNNINMDPDIFSQILLDSEYGEFTYYTNRKKDRKIKFQNLDNLDFLKVSFTTYDKNLYEFNGLENTLLLKIRYLNIYYNLPTY
jgi:hypothetical protein